MKIIVWRDTLVLKQMALSRRATGLNSCRRHQLRGALYFSDHSCHLHAEGFAMIWARDAFVRQCDELCAKFLRVKRVRPDSYALRLDDGNDGLHRLLGSA